MSALLEADVRRTSGLAVDLAYQVGGDPRGTPVIFLHGTSANLAVWEPSPRHSPSPRSQSR